MFAVSGLATLINILRKEWTIVCASIDLRGVGAYALVNYWCFKLRCAAQFFSTCNSKSAAGEKDVINQQVRSSRWGLSKYDMTFRFLTGALFYTGDYDDFGDLVTLYQTCNGSIWLRLLNQILRRIIKLIIIAFVE